MIIPFRVLKRSFKRPKRPRFDFQKTKVELIGRTCLILDRCECSILATFLKKGFWLKKGFKMNRILLVALLFFASVSCLELKNLCSSDVFEYRDVLVNAFHVVPLNVTFKSLNHYLIKSSVKCDLLEFNNKTNFWEALRLKHE